jgi:hypothetical protein
MIGRVRPGTPTGERQGYATALAGLWTGLSRTLSHLEAIAAAPGERLADDDALDVLPRLQYALHSASELAHGIDPPPGAERAHAELAAALADARDATGETPSRPAARGPRSRSCSSGGARSSASGSPGCASARRRRLPRR